MRLQAWWSLVGGVPGTLAGALLSPSIGGRTLLIASGVVLSVVGVRVLRPVTHDQRRRAEGRRTAAVVVVAAAAVGLLTGMLANGGGFLLDATTLSVLRAWRSWQHAEQPTVAIDGDGWVFTDADGHPVHPHAIERLARRACVPVIRLHDVSDTTPRS